jgi:hypothetical protein
MRFAAIRDWHCIGSKNKVSEQKEESSRPRQQQNRQPGLESEMQPRPRVQDGGRHYTVCESLKIR